MDILVHGLRVVPPGELLDFSLEFGSCLIAHSDLPSKNLEPEKGDIFDLCHLALFLIYRQVQIPIQVPH